MTQPPYAPLSTGRLPCVPCRRPWGIVAERLHAIACRALGSATRAPALPPSANGKAERFIRTMLSGWAHGAIYRNSDEHAAALDGWPWHHNCQRRHPALAHKPSIARLDARRTNFLGTYP